MRYTARRSVSGRNPAGFRRVSVLFNSVKDRKSADIRKQFVRRAGRNAAGKGKEPSAKARGNRTFPYICTVPHNEATRFMELHTDAKSRIEAVDALRGFAVMAILLVHNLEHFIFPVYPADSAGWLGTLDQGVSDVVFSLFAGKAYAIFALLFGFTFHIQADRRKREGRDFGYRFLWRLVLLAGFAALNAAFFPRGRRTASVRRGRSGALPHAALERRSAPRRSRGAPVAARRVVSLLRLAGGPGAPAARLRSGRPVCGSGRIYESRGFRTLPRGQPHPWARKPVCCGP